MSKELRRIILFGAPLFVGVINIFHPVHFEPTGVYEDIHGVVGWWIVLHVLNLFGFALLGLAAYLLIQDEHGVAATIAKIAIAIFIPTYAGFDSIIGIGTGVLIRYANGVPAIQLAILNPTIDAYWTNNVAILLATLGSMSWGLAMALSAVSFTETKKPAILVLGLISGAVTGWGYSSSTFGTLPWWIIVIIIGAVCLLISRPGLPVAMLILSGILFGTTHAVPYGPLGMLCFALAAALLEVAPHRAHITQTMATTAS
jgi:hypothetical protein